MQQAKRISAQCEQEMSPAERMVKRILGWACMIVGIIVWCQSCVDAI